MFYQMICYSKANLWVATYNILNADNINSEQEARGIGEYIAHKLYDGLVDFEKYITKVIDHKDKWIISFSFPASPPEETEDGFVKHTAILGGGGPEIHLDKATGKIIYWCLQK